MGREVDLRVGDDSNPREASHSNAWGICKFIALFTLYRNTSGVAWSPNPNLRLTRPLLRTSTPRDGKLSLRTRQILALRRRQVLLHSGLTSSALDLPRQVLAPSHFVIQVKVSQAQQFHGERET